MYVLFARFNSAPNNFVAMWKPQGTTTGKRDPHWLHRSIKYGMRIGGSLRPVLRFRFSEPATINPRETSLLYCSRDSITLFEVNS